MRINLTDVETRDFEALPAGRYVAKITDYEMRETKGEGKLGAGVPMINWEFTVISNAKTGETKYANRRLWMNTVIHEKTLFNLKAMLIATGKYEAADLEGELEFEPDDVVGSDVVLVVAQREYNGDTVNDVKRVKGLTEEERDEASSLLP